MSLGSARMPVITNTYRETERWRTQVERVMINFKNVSNVTQQKSKFYQVEKMMSYIQKR
jgi:hypothetical protein